MAEADKPKEGRPESPTTARELDFDDDEPASHPQTPAKDVTHASSTTPSKTTATAIGTSSSSLDKPSTTSASGNRSDEASKNEGANTAETTKSTSSPPPPPPKALSPNEQAQLTLQEAFPSVELSVVKAVLAASGGRVEPAFNALLGMTDPDSAAAQHQDQQQHFEPPPPTQPPRPRGGPPLTVGGGMPVKAEHAASGRSQLEADELYARQLAEHYNRQDARAMSGQQQRRRDDGYARHGQATYYEDEERERNFIDDDLPEIGENIRKGFLETQKTFNGWLNTLKKKIDGDEESEDDEHPPQLPARRQPAPGAATKSYDYDRYDADPEEFGSDLSKLQLRDETGDASKQPGRRANPDLFKPTPAVPRPEGGRRVSFQEGPPEEIGGSNDAAKPTKSNKWQPLSAVDPSPVADHDPFSLGDSDDEESSSKKKPSTDSEGKESSNKKADQTNLLEKATAEAMAGEIGDEPSGKLELKDNTEAEDKKK